MKPDSSSWASESLSRLPPWQSEHVIPCRSCTLRAKSCAGAVNSRPAVRWQRTQFDLTIGTGSLAFHQRGKRTGASLSPGCTRPIAAFLLLLGLASAGFASASFGAKDTAEGGSADRNAAPAAKTATPTTISGATARDLCIAGNPQRGVVSPERFVPTTGSTLSEPTGAGKNLTTRQPPYDWGTPS